MVDLERPVSLLFVLFGCVLPKQPPPPQKKLNYLFLDFPGFLSKVVPVSGQVYVSSSHVSFRATHLLSKTKVRSGYLIFCARPYVSQSGNQTDALPLRTS